MTPEIALELVKNEAWRISLDIEEGDYLMIRLPLVEQELSLYSSVEEVELRDPLSPREGKVGFELCEDRDGEAPQDKD